MLGRCGHGYHRSYHALSNGLLYLMLRTNSVHLRAIIAFVSFILLATCFFFSGCTPHVYSYWRDRDIIIDGKGEKWSDAKVYLRSKNVAVAAFNDDKFLYLYLVTWDPELRSRILHSGLTVWFDTRAGKRKIFGVSFPVRGLKEKNDSSAVAILGADGKGFVSETAEIMKVKGIEVKISEVEQNAMYELKVPLLKSEGMPYAIGAKAPGAIGVCFEISRFGFDRHAGAGYGGTSRHHGGRGGGYGGSRHGFGANTDSNKEGSGMVKPESERRGISADQGLELWLTLELSKDEK